MPPLEDHKPLAEPHRLLPEDRKPIHKPQDHSASQPEHSRSHSGERSKRACSTESLAADRCSRVTRTVVELLVCNIAAGMLMHSRSSSRRHNGRRRRREQLER